MDESRYLKLHGCRFFLGFVLSIVYLVPVTSWEAETESARSWMLIDMLLLMCGVSLPWMVSAYYMRRYRYLADDQ